MSNQRKQMIIEKEFQYSFIKSTLLIVVASLLAFLGMQILFFMKMKNYGTTAGLAQDHIYFQFLNDQQTQMTLIGGVFFVLLAIFTLIWALQFSNRIAGPLYRLKNDLKRKAAGEEVEFSFRDEDYFKELPELVNQITKK